jgi:hypothetical protein
MNKSKQYLQLWLTLLAATCLWSCAEDDGPIVIAPTTSAIINAKVGGEEQPNQVFIDLSAEKATAVARNSWDLGFYNGTEFRVIINNSTAALTRSLAKTDITAVTAEDTLEMGSMLDIDAIFGALQGPPPEWLDEASSWTDNPDGELSGTAIAEVSQSADANPVYILNRGKNPDGTQRGWMKIRVLRNGEGYTLQYADISSSQFNELTVSKSNSTGFNYVSLDNGLVSVSPATDSWDLAFTTFTNLIPIGPDTSIPYLYKDFVIQNKGLVEIAVVTVTREVTYEDFAFGAIADQSFSSDITTIGSSWRTVAQPGSGQTTGVKTDRFYVLKDGSDNYYKLRFTRMLNPETGERGYPQIQYDLLTDQ